jgi:hypothetical protein
MHYHAPASVLRRDIQTLTSRLTVSETDLIRLAATVLDRARDIIACPMPR